MTQDTHSPRACEGERCGLRPCRGAAMPGASEEGVLFGYADRSVLVSQEAYAIFLERERGLEAQVQTLGDEVERLQSEIRRHQSQDANWLVGQVCGGDAEYNTVNVVLIGTAPWADLRLGTMVKLAPAPLAEQGVQR